MNAVAVAAAVAVVVAVAAIEAVDVARYVMFVILKLVASDWCSLISFAVEPAAVDAVAAVVQLVEDTATDCLQCCLTFEQKQLHHSPGDSEHKPAVVAAAVAAAAVGPARLAAVVAAAAAVADTAVAAQKTPIADSNSLYNTDCSEQPDQQHLVLPLNCQHHYSQYQPYGTNYSNPRHGERH